MTFRSEDYLHEAADLIETAEITLQHSKYKSTINRAYYSVFNCLSALILSEGLFVKTHSGVKMKFHELFVKTGKCESSLAKRYDVLFNDRLTADYEIDANITFDNAAEALAFAKEFCAFTKAYFNQ